MFFVTIFRSHSSSQVSNEAGIGPAVTIIHHSTRTQSPQRTHTSQVWFMSWQFVTGHTLCGIVEDAALVRLEIPVVRLLRKITAPYSVHSL